MPFFRIKSVKIYTGQKNYTDAVRGVRDKYQVCIFIAHFPSSYWFFDEQLALFSCLAFLVVIWHFEAVRTLSEFDLTMRASLLVSLNHTLAPT